MKDQSRNVRAQGRKLVMGLAMSGLIALVAQGGCASSDTPEFILLPDAGNGTGSNSGTGGSSNQGTGGSSNQGTGGSFATGGSFGSGGASQTGGTTGTGGVQATGGTNGLGGSFGTGSGGSKATGGTTGSGGTKATGGTTGMGGMVGTGGTKATGGTMGGGGAGGAAAPTFTQIYQSILTVYCGGSQCHNPGSQNGVSFSSQSNAYNSVKSRVKAGNPNGSSFYTIITSGAMPPSGSRPTSAQTAEIAAWINAGALNN